MFDQLKTMGAIAGLLKDKERLRETAQRFRDRIERLIVTGTAGGGAVRVSVTGAMRVAEVQLEPALIAGLTAGEGGQAMAQALIKEAANEALTKAQALVHEEAEKQARELGLPGLPGLSSLMG